MGDLPSSSPSVSSETDESTEVQGRIGERRHKLEPSWSSSLWGYMDQTGGHRGMRVAKVYAFIMIYYMEILAKEVWNCFLN
ncbi:hypothetical protein L1987_64474 [Smallanthus sonchifolius]|uniref:Uncharacterized protein n=1 Tax=Smallanthus sonchifolius TaxID=185202 RepID=A0ACB9CG37_9ASTR|nr:hypothetical protein L1987_64474 [Smallanthus sonchifolius]